jgi:nitrate reductase gamma subunit
MNKLAGVICLAAGIALLVWGHNVSQAIDSTVKNLFTGSPTNQAVALYIGGAVLCAVGLFQLVWNRKL